MEKANVYAKHNRANIAPKKVEVVMNLVRGIKLHEAKLKLAFDSTKAAKMLLKVLKSAEANAVNNHGYKAETLKLTDVYVTPGKMQKTGRPGSKGRFDPILKRSSHIVVGLTSSQPKEEGKGSKNKK